MKRTSTMVYKPTEESRELVLYADNTYSVYSRSIMPTVESLRKKAAKGVYDPDKAVDAFYYVATAASEAYNREFGYKFSVQDRFTAAVELEAEYREDIIEC